MQFFCLEFCVFPSFMHFVFCPSHISISKAKFSLYLTNQVLCQEAICRSGCIDQHILDLSTSLGSEDIFTHLSHFTPWGKSLSTHSKGGLVGPRVSLDEVEKRKLLALLGLKLQALVIQPITSCYPSSFLNFTFIAGGPVKSIKSKFQYCTSKF
jgi:hypothetical protein